MFYKLIEKKRNEWLSSNDCTIKELLNYIEQKGMMRDAQLEAIKTYLFLKIACNNRPLWELFVNGVFNDTNIDQLELTENVRQIFNRNSAAVALFQYSRLKDKKGRQLAPELEKYIKQNVDKIDYVAAFKQIFYGVDYTDYLFSLPMGAGKTYLMASFIYLDLYFAQNAPQNPAFAHNFMVMAPSGLKSSIVPSLKHIKEFDPSWIIPEPTATQLRRLITFEILDEQKTANKSNLIKNPNAQKINNHQPLEDLMGLVAITNAEKVILERYDSNPTLTLFSDEELKRMKLANELREIIGYIPNLAVYIDEVHHAADGEIKLRQVVNKWTVNNSFNSVLGFSGTPYLDNAESLKLSEDFSFRNTDLANVVYYYPLINGIGNFLKTPEVKFADNDTLTIVTNGVKEFLDKYRNITYNNETCAKLAIYCGKIETLEEYIYPLIAEIVASYGLNPTDVILKYHGGNEQYPQPEGSELEFSSLDTPLSKKKIVLLVQIGKEGWDCKSLTGVILPQKGVCPTNMVLQTSCRCLRQVIKNSHETAIIWLNQYNADKLNRQLEQQQNITLKEFSNKPHTEIKLIDRYSRIEKMHVPNIDFYQLKISYEELVVDNNNNPSTRLKGEKLLVPSKTSLIYRQDMERKLLSTYEQGNDEIVHTSFQWWLQQIAKESFGTLTVSELKKCENELNYIFKQITTEKGDMNIENNKYDHQRIRSLIRQAFIPVRKININEEIIRNNASLLKIEKLTSPVEDSVNFYPNQEVVHDIISWDTTPPQQELTAEQKAKIEELKALGMNVSQLLRPIKDPHPERNQTFHYIPYRFDSTLERIFFSEEIIPLIVDKKLEIYFNGDDTLTDFKINCYRKDRRGWRSLGSYVPDFLLFSRNEDNKIDKIIIIETKGEGYAAKFKERKEFMEKEWIIRNNEKFGYKRFEFLYLEDTLNQEQRRIKTINAIKEFFNM